MFSYNILAGSTDQSVVIRIVDSTDGTPETGVVYNTAGLALEYRREGAASTAITEATLAALTTAHADGGFLHIGNGYYRLDLPDAAVAAGVTGCLVHGTCTGMIVIGCYINLNPIPVDVRNWTGTAVATPDTAGHPKVTVKSGVGSGEILTDAGRARCDVRYWDGSAVAAVDTAGYPKVTVKSGTGTGELSLSSGRVNSDTVYWNGAAVATPDTAGYPKTTIKSGAGTGELSLSSGGVTLTTSSINSVADQVWDEDITGHRAANAAGAMLQPLHSGACQSGGNTTTVVLASSASSVDDYYNGDLVVGWVTADGTNKFADYISDYVGSTRAATVTGIPVSPGTTYTYVILPGGSIPGASAPTASAVADAVWDEVMSGHVTEGTYGNAIGGQITHEGNLQSAASTSSVVLDATGSSSTDNFYRYQSFEVVAGTGAGQSSYISAYTGSSKTATLAPALTTILDSTSRYVIRKLGLDASTPANVATAVWAATRASNATAGSFGEYVNADVVRLSGDATAADNQEAFFDGTGYAGTNNVIPSVTTVTGNVNGNVGGSVGSVTGAVGSVTGSVGSVAGAVGSVTGDVGGNVVGSVASVTGSVGSVTAGVTLTNAGIDALFTRQLTESYAADGAAPTVAQALMLIQQTLGDFSISGTTLTVKKLDGSTTAATFTLNDGSSPTAVTRAS